MKKYKVIAPAAVFAIKQGADSYKEYALRQGDTVDLPVGNVAVAALLLRGVIAVTDVPVDAPTTPRVEVATEGQKQTKK
jgi:hypothetical protein